jgi:hypothetical protein
VGVIAMVNGAAVLEYGNHLPSFHEPPLRFAMRTTIPDKGENNFFVQDYLNPFIPDQNAEVIFNTDIQCPQSTGRSSSGKRKTANDCRTPRRLRRWVFTPDRNQPLVLFQF